MNFTDEDRARGQEQRKQRRAEALALPLKRDFLDDETWKELASERGLRLPNWTFPPESKAMRRWLRKVKLPEKVYLEIMGYSKLEQFQELNPDWPLRAWVGVLLEFTEERDQAKNVLKRRPE